MYLETNKKTNNSGVSILEVIIYSALLTLLLGVIIYVINIIFVTNTVIKATRRVENSAIASMDRIIRGIRESTSVNAGDSVFGVDSGRLSLIIPTDSGTRLVKFYLNEQKIYVEEDGVVIGPLTLSDTRTTSLKFNLIASTTPVAIKFEMTIAGPTSTASVSEKFYGTAVMRGSYQ